MSQKLTELLVAKAAPPPSGRVTLWDAMLPGFGLRITDKGAKSWIVMYRLGGRDAPRKRLKLGSYPAVSLASARVKARHAFQEVAHGNDPAAKRDEPKPETFEAVAADFIDRYAKPKNRGWKSQETDIARDLTPQWGKRPIGDITRRDVLHVLDRVAARASPVRANRLLALIRKIFAWCLERGIIDSSPAANIKPPGKEVSRDRVLSDEEIRQVWTACDHVGKPFDAIFKLLLITAQRRHEVGRMRWSDLDLRRGIWTIPREIAKNGIANEVPLPSLAISILSMQTRVVRADGREEEYVFPAANGSGKPASGYSKAKARVDALCAQQRAKEKLPPMPSWWLHDLRRTAASSMARLGVAPHVIERVLNHISGSQAGVAGIYNRYGYLPEKKEALDRWAAHLEQLVSGEADEDEGATEQGREEEAANLTTSGVGVS